MHLASVWKAPKFVIVKKIVVEFYPDRGAVLVVLEPVKVLEVECASHMSPFEKAKSWAGKPLRILEGKGQRGSNRCPGRRVS